jgi:hypothetical protein
MGNIVHKGMHVLGCIYGVYLIYLKYRCKEIKLIAEIEYCVQLMRTSLVIILINIFMGCGSENKPFDNFPIDCVTPRFDQIHGTWAYYDKSDGYAELEISDSLYWYVDYGNYEGPLVALAYKLQGDSLFTLDDDGNKDRGWEMCFQDSLTIRIKNQFDYFVCKKINPRLKISNWTVKDSTIYDDEFLTREKDF